MDRLRGVYAQTFAGLPAINVMDVISLLKLVLAPTAASAVITLVAVVLLLRYLGQWRKELLAAIVVEVKRDMSGTAPEVRIQTPLVTKSDDPYVQKSVCDLHHRQFSGRVDDLTGRVERLERKLDNDITRLHERVDELPQRMVELLKPLLKD